MVYSWICIYFTPTLYSGTFTLHTQKVLIYSGTWTWYIPAFYDYFVDNDSYLGGGVMVSHTLYSTYIFRDFFIICNLSLSPNTSGLVQKCMFKHNFKSSNICVLVTGQATFTDTVELSYIAAIGAYLLGNIQKQRKLVSSSWIFLRLLLI